MAPRRTATAPHAPIGTCARRRWRRGRGLGRGTAVRQSGSTASRSGHTGLPATLARIDADSAGAIDPGSNRLVSETQVAAAGPGKPRVRVRIGLGRERLRRHRLPRRSRHRNHAGHDPGGHRPDSDRGRRRIGVGHELRDEAGRPDQPQTGHPWVQRLTGRQRPERNRGEPRGSSGSPNRLDDTVTKIDQQTGKPRRTFPAGPSPSDIAYGLGALWVANESTATVTRVDPDTGALEEIGVGNGPEAVTAGGGAVWVANSLDGTVSRIDPTQNIVAAVIPVGGRALVRAREQRLGLGRRQLRGQGRTGSIWDRTTSTSTLAVGSGPQSLVSLDGRVWLTARQVATSHRGGTLHPLRPRYARLARPGESATSRAPGRCSRTTSDALVGYRRVGGLEEGTIVPDLATSIPLPTNGGTTYTFHLRRGDPTTRPAGLSSRATSCGPSSGHTGLAAPYASYYFSGIVGAGAVLEGELQPLARDRQPTTARGTITFRLRAPDPEFLYKIALPAADPVPPRRLAVEADAARRPRERALRGRELRPRTPGTRPQSALSAVVCRRTAGGISRTGSEWTYWRTHWGSQLTAVEQGQGRPDRWPRRHPDTTRSPPGMRPRFTRSRRRRSTGSSSNTRVPPFNNLAARQAFNFAIDRTKAILGQLRRPQ